MVKTFWNNGELRGSLWNDLLLNPDPSAIIKAQKLTDFKLKVNSLGSELYNFIVIK